MIEPNDFLKLIRQSFRGSETVYTKGSCYRLYEILKAIYPTAKAYSNTKHIIIEIDGRFYDIRGERGKRGYRLYEKEKDPHSMNLNRYKLSK